MDAARATTQARFTHTSQSTATAPPGHSTPSSPNGAAPSQPANNAAATALSKLLMLSVFPSSFDQDAAAALLNCSKQHVEAQVSHIQSQHPGHLERVGEGMYRICPSVAGQLQQRLATAPSAHLGALLRMTAYCTEQVAKGAAVQELAPLVAHILQLVADDVLPPAAINRYLGLHFCRCMDRMCVGMKRYSWAERAFRKLLEDPHDPCCPFCAFHLYPAMHAQGKLSELEVLLQDLPRLGISPSSPMYQDVNVYLDVLTSRAYALALQRKGKEAEAAAKLALDSSSQPYQQLNNFNNLIFALRLQRKFEEAEEYAAMAKAMMASVVDLDTRFVAESLMTTGLLSYDVGQVEEAEEQLLAAVEASQELDDFVDVDDIRILARYHAAKALLAQQDKVKASQAVVLLQEALVVQQRCAPSLPFRHKLGAALVEAVIALFTLPS